MGTGLLSAARGEDITTLTGQTFSNVVVQQFDRQGIFIRHDGGHTQVLFTAIQPELRGFYKSRSLFPLPMETFSGVNEGPVGSNDLVTLSGQIYRNVVLKQVNNDNIRIAHDTGMDTVYFSSMSPGLQEKYRTGGVPVIPDPAPDANDLVTTYGQVFRNIEILRSEPDGLTFHHDGGMTKLWFPSLSDELRQKYKYDPVAAWNYQRETAAASQPQQNELAPEVQTGSATVSIQGIKTEKLEDNKYWINFSVKNLTDQPQTIQIVPCAQSMVAIIRGKNAVIPAGAEAALQQITVPEIQPRYLKVTCGSYQTNCLLNW
jgi:hypothetical protein